MEIKKIAVGDRQISEILDDRILVSSVQDILDMMANAGAREIIMHQHQFEPAFFDLGSGLLGDILQKLTNYRVRLAVVGDFGKRSKNFQAFIGESNRHGSYLFVGSVDEAIGKWS